MIVILIADLRAWAHYWGRVTVAVLAGGMLLLLVLIHVQAQVFLAGMVLFCLWLGWVAASQRWNEVKAGDWVLKQRRSASAWMLGKMASGGILIILHLLIVLPLLWIAARSWGMPVPVLALVIMVCWSSGLTSLALGLAGGRSENFWPSLLSGVLFFVWFVLGLINEDLHGISPLYQLWTLGESGEIDGCLVVSASNLGLSLLGTMAGVWAIRLIPGRRPR